MASKILEPVLQMAEEEITDVRDKIVRKVYKEERNIRWLSRKTEYGYDGLYNCLIKKHYDLTDDRLSKINDVLNTSFTT